MRDEEVHIPQLLATAHLFADEIVLVDTGSVDRTKEEALKFTPHVHDFAWCDDFSAARNFGIERCTKDFVLWLDADDVVAEEDARRIRPLLAGEIGWDVIMLPYHYVHDEQGRTTLLTRRERIFRNRRGFKFEYPVHECLKYPPGAVVANNTEINVHHRNLKRREPSNVRNLRILSRAVENPAYAHDFRMWWLLAAEEAPETSIVHYRKVLAEFGPELSSSLHSEVCVEFARKLLLTERTEEALHVLGRAIALYPLWREPFFIAGQIHWRQRRFAEALRLFQIAGTIPAPTLGIGNLDHKIYDGDEYYEWLFLACHEMQDREGALKAIDAALARNPANARFLERRRDYAGSGSQPKGKGPPRYLITSSFKGFAGPRELTTAVGRVERRQQIERQIQAIGIDLMFGADRAGLVDRLEKLGAPSSEARRIIETAISDPLIITGREMALMLRKRDWLLGALERLQRLSPRAKTVERRAGMSGGEFLEFYYARNRPVVIEGEMEGWPARAKWDLAFLNEAAGLLPRGGGIVAKGDEAAIEVAMSAEAFTLLASDLGRLDKFLDPSAPPRDGALRIAQAGAFVPLGCDPRSRLLAQISGRVQIKLAASADVAKIYNRQGLASEIRDLDAPDLDAARRFPMISQIKFYEIDLEPGEILFVPMAWWCQIRSLSFGVTASFVNFRWPNDMDRIFPARLEHTRTP